jgi:hypothetical protein
LVGRGARRLTFLFFITLHLLALTDPLPLLLTGKATRRLLPHLFRGDLPVGRGARCLTFFGTSHPLPLNPSFTPPPLL